MFQGLSFLNRVRRSQFLFLALCLLIFVVILAQQRPQQIVSFECYKDTEIFDADNLNEGPKRLEDVLLSESVPPPGRTIFFHETRCHSPFSQYILNLTARQACAIESAALNNPNFQVFVLFASYTYLPEDDDYKDPLLDAIRSYKNVKFRQLNIWRYAKDTPIEDWFKKGDLFRSNFLTEHTSDLLRLLTLYRFGGIYLDLDVVVLKSLEYVPLNYVGAHDNLTLGNAVISLEPRDPQIDLLTLNSRQACAIESAALHNPNFQVFVLFTCSTSPDQSDSIIEALLSYKNVELRRVNLWRFAEGTPVEEWVKTDKLFRSKFMMNNISNLLRILCLYRFGGIYMDMDVVVLRSFENVPLNFLGAELKEFVSNAVIGLEPEGFGHKLGELFLRDFQNNYNGDIWGHNGPRIVASTAEENKPEFIPFPCYMDPETKNSIDSPTRLEDVLLSDVKPTPGRTIFFHETKCHSPNSQHIMNLTARQACSIESAALHNPNFQVFVLFASPTYLPKSPDQKLPLIDAIKSYKNVHLRQLNIWRYARDTPIEDWVNKGELFNSSFLTEHTSDLLRLMSLYRFGGIYMDIDVMVLRSLEDIPLNYVGAQEPDVLCNAVISLEPEGRGHEIAEIFLRDFQQNYNGKLYVNNGPSLMGRVAKNICGCIVMLMRLPLMLARFLHKRRLIFLVLFVLVVGSIVCLSYTWQEDAQLCFMAREHSESQPMGSLMDATNANIPRILDDVLLTEPKPVPGRSIFFHETSCHRPNKRKRQRPGQSSDSQYNMLQLTARQACAIESAALHNPNFQVFVLFAGPTYHHVGNNTNSSGGSSQRQQPLIDALLSYKNVQFRQLNLWRYATGTPIEEWLNDGKLFRSSYLFSHISDFLRFLTLYRYGGVYLDMDVVMLRSIEDVPPNFTGAESNTHLAAGVMSLAPTGFGHEIADLCLRDFMHNFDGSDWGNNGPGVITRVAQSICGTKDITLMLEDRKRCLGFKVFDRNAFYAVPWKHWRHFFEPQLLEQTLAHTKDSILVHVWNKHSKQQAIKVGSSTAYGKYAEQHCPRSYAAAGEYF
ncbi:hypothetical protein ACLKA6_012060 [Drosophila palustris]